MDPGTLVVIVTVIVAGITIALGTIAPTVAEGRAVERAIEGMARQPDMAKDLRSTMIISLALLESEAIYVLLIVLILLFANPLLRLIP
ncbi:MAG: ATP synthase F0 subunit C [Anaerolineales bacterium]|nr:ATP synthase F0 subunit C [Anaerolineales bacterium]